MLQPPLRQRLWWRMTMWLPSDGRPYKSQRMTTTRSEVQQEQALALALPLQPPRHLPCSEVLEGGAIGMPFA